jgi:hypothetical protein
MGDSFKVRWEGGLTEMEWNMNTGREFKGGIDGWTGQRQRKRR